MCTCKEDKGIAYYEYIKIDKHMGFVDHDRYSLNPKYCPWCGEKQKANPEEENEV